MNLKHDLFFKIFTRYLVALLISLVTFFGVTLFLMNQYLFEEWKQDLRDEAGFMAKQYDPETLDAFINNFQLSHSHSRLMVFNPDHEIIADSKPKEKAHGFQALSTRKKKIIEDNFLAIEELKDGSHLVLLKTPLHTIPAYLILILLVTLLVIFALVALVLYPVSRKLSRTMGKLSGLSDQVASGHFGMVIKDDIDAKSADELEMLVVRFNHMSRRLLEARQLNDRLISDVSHELRSPLARIRILAETIEYRPQEQKSCISGIEKEIKMLDAMIEDLLFSGKLISGKEMLSPQAFKAVNWVQDVIKQLAVKIEAENLEWSLTVPPFDFTVMADKNRLSQVLGNLVDNSIKALTEISSGKITVTITHQIEKWQIIVNDNGPKIPDSEIPHLFKRFYRAESHRSRKTGGVGLGLSIVQSIIDYHKGDIRIQSSENTGTTVTIDLPVIF
jgi:signal transduction histidine kinase